MSLTINSNSSLANLQNIRKSSNDLLESFEKLSSGKRINKASDDPAGLAIALGALTEADTSSVAVRNINDGVSVANVADGAISTASDITVRLSELATQASNGTLSDQQRSALNDEFQALTSELDRISQTTSFNGQQLLSEDSSVAIQAGTDSSANSRVEVNLPGVSSSSLGLAGLDISTADGARAALEQVDTAQQDLSEARADIGASVSRLGSALNNLQSSELGQREAASRILDADIAKQSSQNIASNIRLQAGVSVQAQANSNADITLKLLE